MSSNSIQFNPQLALPGATPPQGATGLQGLPADVLSHILSYTPEPRTMAGMQRTCRYFKTVVDEEKEVFNKQIKSHPFLHYLLENSSQIQGKHSYKEKMPILDRYAQVAKNVQRITRSIDRDVQGFVQVFGRRHIYSPFSELTKNLRRQRRSALETTHINPKESVRGLAKQAKGIAFDDLFISSILLQDVQLINSFNLELIDRKTIDVAAYLYLLENKIEQFNQLLPHTSIFEENLRRPAPNGYVWNQDVLKTFLILAAKNGELDLFKKLIELKKPYNTDEVLIELASGNCAEAIRILMSSAKVNQEYISDNGMSYGNSGTPGFHTALMDAANLNHQDTFNALLQARPGQQIDRRILENIRDLFQDDPNEIDPPQNLLWNDWRRRRDNYPDRAEMIQRLNDQIAERYPVEEMAPVQELVEPQANPPQQPIVIEPRENRLSLRERIGALAIAPFANLWNYFSNR